MASSLRILAFSGSTRRESFNRKLLHQLAEATRVAGAELTLIDLSDYSMPIYQGDLEDESGMPAAAVTLSEMIAAHHGLLITSPEYNSMMTPLLKNTIDWCTRGETNPFEGKVVAVASASPGQFGGVRSQTLVRQLMLHLGAHVVPAQCTISQADKAFNEQGALASPRSQQSVRKLAEALVELTRKVHVLA